MNNAWKKSKRSDEALWHPPVLRQSDTRQCSQPLCCEQVASTGSHRQQQAIAWPPGYEQRGGRMLVPFPQIPRCKSNVPWLTSLHATDGRGEYGSSTFRGNCSGLL